jgi:serine/threonine protein phosphatase PrpC
MYNRVPIDKIAGFMKDKSDLKTRLIELAEYSKEQGEKDNITGIGVQC